MESPLTWTTQAPHWLVSHPTWVPARPRLPRRKSTSNVRASTSPLAALPLTVMLTETMPSTSQLPLMPCPMAGSVASAPRYGAACSLVAEARFRACQRQSSQGLSAQEPQQPEQHDHHDDRSDQPNVPGLARLGGRQWRCRGRRRPGPLGLERHGLGHWRGHRRDRGRGCRRDRFGRDHRFSRPDRSRCGGRGQRRRLRRVLVRDDGRELAEEVVGHLPGRALDQPRADLGQLAADVSLGGVAQDRVGAILGQIHLGAALGETGSTALAFARDTVADGRIEIVQGDLAGERGTNRSDLGPDPRVQLMVRKLVQLLAAGNRRFEDLGVVQRLPDPLARRRDTVLAGHVHALELPRWFPGRTPAWARWPQAGVAYTGPRAAARRAELKPLAA